MEKLETAFQIFGLVVACASAIIKLLPAAKEGSLYAKFIAVLDKASIFCAKYKK